MKTLTPERRRFARSALSTRLSINLLHPHAGSVSHVNYSEGGVCLRLEGGLEVRSLIRLQVAPARPGDGVRRAGARAGDGQRRPIECTGRVAWIIQRLDLRSMPPFLFDVGIEFVDPPPLLRRLIAQRNFTPLPERNAPGKSLDAAVIRGRQFIPRLARETGHLGQWHLVISVDGAPCFSGRYVSERTALTAWTQFQRRQVKR